MQLIKNYVNKYEFNIENEIKDSQKLALTGTLTFKQLEYNNSGENIIITNINILFMFNLANMLVSSAFLLVLVLVLLFVLLLILLPSFF